MSHPPDRIAGPRVRIRRSTPAYTPGIAVLVGNALQREAVLRPATDPPNIGAAPRNSAICARCRGHA